MLKLKDIKKAVSMDQVKAEETSTPLEDLKPLEIGFKVESRFEIAKRSLRKKWKFWVEEMRVSGIYTDFWLWNFIFINLFAIFAVLFMISKYFSQLPEMLGVNYDDNWSYDFLISKNFLYLVPIVHLIIIICAIILAVKSQKRLTHVFIVAFVQMTLLIIFELIGIRNLFVYFL